MSVAVAARREGVHRVDPIAGCGEGPNEQASVDLDPNRDLCWFLSVSGQHLMQSRHALDAIGEASLGQDTPRLVEDAHIVVRLGPVDPHEDQPHPSLPTRRVAARSPRGGLRRANGPVLRARHPTGRLATSPTGGGTL
jgi:hypothetical protein